MALLSVVLPNYNHALYLPRALDAILGQTRPAGEVIVVDDGSTDESLSVLERYASQYPCLAIVAHEQNLGVVAALNRGLSEATGKYVYMAAADDEVMPRFFELGLAALERYPAVGLFTGTTVLHDGTTERVTGRRPVVWPRYRPGVVSPEQTARRLRRSDNFILTGASLLLTDAVQEAGGLAGDLGSFADGFLVRKIALERGFYFDPRQVATWNVHKDGFSRRSATEAAEAAKVLEVSMGKIRDDPAFPPGYAELFGRRWRFAIARIALQRPLQQRDVIGAVVEAGHLDRQVLRLAARLPGRLSALGSLSWLYLRLRPTSLPKVIGTGVVARLTSRQHRRLKAA